MKRTKPLLIAAIVLGALGTPSSVFARSDCTYTASQDHALTVPAGSATVTVYADASGNNAGTTGTAAAAAGTCADNVAPAAGFDGGLAEAGAGEDPATGAADPGLVPDQPNVYAVVDGSDANIDPSDGYVGVSNYETGPSRNSESLCTAAGPDHGSPASSNSGGCVGIDAGPWVHVPGDAPTPICGNMTGNGWDGSGNLGPGSRDGCEPFDFVNSW